jgi:beta-lactamase class D
VPEDQGSRTKKRVILAVGVVLVAAVTIFGVVQLQSDDTTAAPAAEEQAAPTQLTAADVANEFLTDLTTGQSAAAATLTDDVAGATAQLTAVWTSLAPVSARAERTGAAPAPTDATETDQQFTLTWTFAGDRTWAYQSGMHLVKNTSGWRVHWQPALVHPKLGPGQSLAMRDGQGQAAVVDRDGTPLLTASGTGTAPVDPAVAPRLTGMMGRVAAGQGGAQSWYVAVTDAAGNDVEVVQGQKSGALVSTLSVPVQNAAQAAVDTQQQPTMLVAIQPSSGDVLAVAQNAAAGTDPTALNGLYPPGSTFKIATATALIESGIADVDTVVPCPGSTTVGQRTVRNAGFELGDVPLRTAFARSCNTTFAEQSAGLAPDKLTDAASQLGLGADFEIPDIKTEAGSVPEPANATEQVENSIGQGRVQVSCFGMALAATTVAAGQARTPRLWRDLQTSVLTSYEGPPPGVVASLRSMMRAVVTSGTATGLAPYGQVFGKTGTAEVGGGGAAHGWFTGYRGDVAFATLVVNGSTSKVAVDVTGRFLGALG